MNWNDLVKRALKTCTRGGGAPQVVYRDAHESPGRHELLERLVEEGRGGARAARLALSAWSREGAWPRSAWRSGWYLRAFLDWLDEQQAPVQDTRRGGSDGPVPAAQNEAFLLEYFDIWEERILPELLDDLAGWEESVLKTLKLADD